MVHNDSIRKKPAAAIWRPTTKVIGRPIDALAGGDIRQKCNACGITMRMLLKGRQNFFPGVRK
jgi:hypothetical protein